jgi:hypothetical protein
MGWQRSSVEDCFDIRYGQSGLFRLPDLFRPDRAALVNLGLTDSL